MDPALPFHGYNRPGLDRDQGVIDSFWHAATLSSIHAEYESMRAFSETYFTEDLKRFDLPTLFIHGNDDRIVPFANSAHNRRFGNP